MNSQVTLAELSDSNEVKTHWWTARRSGYCRGSWGMLGQKPNETEEMMGLGSHSNWGIGVSCFRLQRTKTSCLSWSWRGNQKRKTNCGREGHPPTTTTTTTTTFSSLSRSGVEVVVFLFVCWRGGSGLQTKFMSWIVSGFRVFPWEDRLALCLSEGLQDNGARGRLIHVYEGPVVDSSALPYCRSLLPKAASWCLGPAAGLHRCQWTPANRGFTPSSCTRLHRLRPSRNCCSD